MGLIDRLRRRSEERDIYALSMQQAIEQWNEFFRYGGVTYALTGLGAGSNAQGVSESYESFIERLWRTNGIVFACMALRLRVFSDVRLRFREFAAKGPAKFIDTTDGRNPSANELKLLRRPERGLTTGDLLAHAIQDVDMAGNWFGYRDGQQIRRLRPDWVTVVYGSPRKAEDVTMWDLDSELLGYVYKPGGDRSDSKPVALRPETVAHWAPQPDPCSPRLGMSWLTPIIREVLSDTAATSHKLSFFENDATVNQQLVFNEGTDKEMFDIGKRAFLENHEGARNAYRTLFALNAKLEKIGTDFKEMDFGAIQGRGETRIASAAGVHPVLVALSEGLQGSSLNAGNFSSARRSTADMTFRPLWRNFCGSLATIVTEPANGELWYDGADCQFLQEDRKDAAEIQEIQANTIASLVREGFEADDVVDAVVAEDMTLLKGKHNGLPSVQQRPDGAPAIPAGSNGNGKVEPAPVG
jgi:hypothetical protein